MSNKKKKQSAGSPFLVLLLFVFLGVFLYSGWKLLTLWKTYKAGSDEYSAIEEQYTKKAEDKPEAAENVPESAIKYEGMTESEIERIKEHVQELEKDGAVFENAVPPLQVDFDELRKVNEEIVAWIYVDAFPETISYPVCRADDNDYYLHRTFRKQNLFSGAIFENCTNSPDFTDPHTIVYGHNMKDRSMFGNLKFLKEQDRYDKNPYFWILTPKGNYRYRIFAAFDTPVTSDVYTLFSAPGPEITKWEKAQQALSAVKNDITFRDDDFVVTLSTCTADSSVRCVIIGKCVSSDRPDNRTAAAEP